MKGEVVVADGLTRYFGNLVAVDSLSLRVHEGEVFGLLGPNGAGKTTVVRMLCCLINPTAGRAYISGFQVGKDSLKIRQIVGLLPENPGLYDELSAYGNLDFYARLYGVPRDRREENIERFLKMLDLWDRRNDPVGSFSKGMKQKMAIARALVHEPQVLFLDEPTAGLAPESAKVVRDFVLELKEEGRTIFLCTHNLDEAEHLCDRIGIIKQRLLAEGAPKDLENRLWGRTTVVHLSSLDSRIPEVVWKVRGVKGVEVKGEELFVKVDDPEKQNPEIVEAIVKTGGRIKYVSELRHGLEEVYLRLLGGEEGG